MAPFDHATAQAHFAAYDTAGPADPDSNTWCGAVDNCDVCARPLGSETYMIDGPSESSPRAFWGNLCVVCAFKHSPTIGWGKAQLYKKHNGNWHLIAGGPPPEEDYDL